ncbi:MAG: hypothetical protein AAF495_15910 [Pseudomonadota bacterium]
MPRREAAGAGSPGALIAVGEVRAWSCAPPEIGVPRLLRIHKYTDPSKVRPLIVEAAEKALIEAAALSAPTARCVVVEIESLRDGELRLDGGVIINCPAFDERLAGCDRLLAFLMTLGPDLDAKVRSLVEDVFEPLDALFLETAGWLTIEAATRAMAAELRAEAARSGSTMSLRMGPGYEYRLHNGGRRVRWDLTEQAAIFRLFDGCDLPMELLPSCAMTPKMSRSGIFGLARAD